MTPTLTPDQIEAKILALEDESKQLEPNREVRLSWEHKVQAYAQNFLDEIHNLKAYIPGGENDNSLKDFNIQEDGRPIEALIELIDNQVDHYGINPASGAHFGYIPGGGLYPTALGDYLADVSNRYAGIFYASPGAVKMENLLIRWMCDLIGFPSNSLGNLTSGGSIANLIGIVTARDAKEIEPRRIESSCIYLAEQVHHSILKALRIAGLQKAIIRQVKMNEQYRMDSHDLARQIAADREEGLTPFLAIASFGTTDVGAVDPIDEIASICEANELWLHVDAAYGGFFLMSDAIKSKLKGVERADSVSIDPHKGLFLSYGSGAVIIKDVKAAYNTHHYIANYMQDAIADFEELSPADLSPELTRHFRGLRMWLPMQLFGLKPLRACIEEKLWLCRYFYQKIQTLGFEVGPEPDLSVCIYRYVPDNKDANKFNEALTKLIQHQGDIFVSSTMIDGVFWLRMAIVSFRSHLSHVNQALELLNNGKNSLIEAPQQVRD